MPRARKGVPTGRSLVSLKNDILNRPEDFEENINENRLKNGDLVWISWRNRIIRDSNGNAMGNLGVGQDITKQKHHEERLAKLTRLYSVLSRINESIVRTHDKDLLYSDVCRIVSEDGGFPLVWIGEINGLDVIPVALYGSAKNYLNEAKIELEGELSRGPTGTSILEDRAVVNDDFETNPAIQPWHQQSREYGFRASAAIPIHHHNKVLGALTLYSFENLMPLMPNKSVY